MAEKKEFKDIVRIADVDVTGKDSVYLALTRVKGVDFMFSSAICSVLGLNKMLKVGELSSADIEKIEDCMRNPAKYGIIPWLFNRRKDLETGKDEHLISVDVGLQKNTDIRFLKKIRCYRGARHAMGAKKVRGQRTRTSGRTKAGPIGVQRKKKSGKK